MCFVSEYPNVFITIGDASLGLRSLEFINAMKKNDGEYNKFLWTGSGLKLWNDYIYEQNTKEVNQVYKENKKFLEEHE